MALAHWKINECRTYLSSITSSCFYLSFKIRKKNQPGLFDDILPTAMFWPSGMVKLRTDTTRTPLSGCHKKSPGGESIIHFLVSQLSSPGVEVLVVFVISKPLEFPFRSEMMDICGGGVGLFGSGQNATTPMMNYMRDVETGGGASGGLLRARTLRFGRIRRSRSGSWAASCRNSPAPPTDANTRR